LSLNTYNRQKIKALLVDFQDGYSSYGIFKVPGVNGVVEMIASCDCNVDKTDIIHYLLLAHSGKLQKRDNTAFSGAMLEGE
jgi:hypothetical protein